VKRDNKTFESLDAITNLTMILGKAGDLCINDEGFWMSWYLKDGMEIQLRYSEKPGQLVIDIVDEGYGVITDIQRLAIEGLCARRGIEIRDCYTEKPLPKLS